MKEEGECPNLADQSRPCELLHSHQAMTTKAESLVNSLKYKPHGSHLYLLEVVSNGVGRFGSESLRKDGNLNGCKFRSKCRWELAYTRFYFEMVYMTYPHCPYSRRVSLCRSVFRCRSFSTLLVCFSFVVIVVGRISCNLKSTIIPVGGNSKDLQ